VELQWKVHPARRRPAAAISVVAVIAVASAFSARVGGHGAWGLSAALFLLVTVASFLFPTRYRLTDGGVEVSLLGALRRREWARLHVLGDGSVGLLLSPSRRAGILDPIRTIFLRYDGNAEEVRSFVRERMP